MVFFCICCRRCVRELEGWILLSPPWNISINCQQDCCPSALWLTGAAVWYTALWLQWDGQKDTVKERKCGLHRLERKWWILVTRGCNRCVHRGQGPVGDFYHASHSPADNAQFSNNGARSHTLEMFLSTMARFCSCSPGGMKQWIRMRTSARNSLSGRQAAWETAPLIAVIAASERLADLLHPVVLPEGMCTQLLRSSSHSAGTGLMY